MLCCQACSRLGQQIQTKQVEALLLTGWFSDGGDHRSLASPPHPRCIQSMVGGAAPQDAEDLSITFEDTDNVENLTVT